MAPRDNDPLNARLATGDERAFTLLYDRSAARLFRAALGMLEQRENAEDVVQEIVVSMIRSQQQLTDIKDLDSYLFIALRRSARRVA